MNALQEAFDRIRQRIDIDSNGCWNWKGSVNGSLYGCIRVGDKVLRTHRVTYAVVHGEVPRGKVVRHKCDNRQCCNPAHLVVGDHEDNTLDAVERGRYVRRKFGDDERAQVVSMRKAGATKREIAVALRCNWYAVSKVLDELGTDTKRVGRPKGSRNQHVRVTEEMKGQMRKLYATGKHSQQSLAEQFGCDQTYVSLIVRWKK